MPRISDGAQFRSDIRASRIHIRLPSSALLIQDAPRGLRSPKKPIRERSRSGFIAHQSLRPAGNTQGRLPGFHPRRASPPAHQILQLAHVPWPRVLLQLPQCLLAQGWRRRLQLPGTLGEVCRQGGISSHRSRSGGTSTGNVRKPVVQILPKSCCPAGGRSPISV